MRRFPSRSPRVGFAAAILAGAMAVAGCTSQTPEPAPSVSTSGPASTPSTGPTRTPTPASTVPVLVPDGTADDNLPIFTAVMQRVAATDRKAEGRAYIDALVAAGFPKDAMEVTNDRTSVDLPADAVQFSVRWDGECLVGQVGPSTPKPTALVLPLVPGGTCLIGQTRPIDW